LAYLYQPIVKYGRFGLPGGFLLGGGRPGLKYGISRKIREIWQPYRERGPTSKGEEGREGRRKGRERGKKRGERGRGG